MHDPPREAWAKVTCTWSQLLSKQIEASVAWIGLGSFEYGLQGRLPLNLDHQVTCAVSA